MLKPSFLLTKTIPIVVNRKTQGGYIDGDWVEGIDNPITIQVNIQPAKDSEILLMPEAQRTREWYKLYSADEIRTLKEGTNGWPADEFVFNGDKYRVMKTSKWSMGILDHFKAFAARVELTPN